MTKALSDGLVRTLFIVSYGRHNISESFLNVAEDIRTVLTYLYPNTTVHVQPCDSFVIEKIKSARRKRWNEYKLTLIEAND